MASRLAQLTVVDCVFVGVAQRTYETTQRALERHPRRGARPARRPEGPPVTAARQPSPVEAPTEHRNPASTDLDLLPTLEVLRLINDEDARWRRPSRRRCRRSPRRSTSPSPHCARAAACTTSARAPPAGSLPGRRRTAADVRGGAGPGRRPPRRRAPTRSSAALEDVEDDEGRRGRRRRGADGGRRGVGLTASGRTPYVAGALAEARRIGRPHRAGRANPRRRVAASADVHVCVDTGPEVLTGSTRMKAGTAQKLVLNAFSTATMVRLGHTYSNLMTGVVATNAKLHGRMVGILIQASGRDLDTCCPGAPRFRRRPQAGSGVPARRCRRRSRPHGPRHGRRRRPRRATPPRGVGPPGTALSCRCPVMPLSGHAETRAPDSPHRP